MFQMGNNTKELNSAKNNKESKTKSQYGQAMQNAFNLPGYLKGIQTGKTGAERIASIWSIANLFKGNKESN